MKDDRAGLCRPSPRVPLSLPLSGEGPLSWGKAAALAALPRSPPVPGVGCFFWQLGLQRGCQWGSGLVFLFIHCGSGLGVHFVGLQRPSLCPEGLRARLTDEPPPPPRRPTLL